MKKIELLAPAGDMECLKAAYKFGADAVYLAGKSFGMRASSSNFSLDELRDAVALTHSLGKKLYLTLNTMPHVDEYPELREFLHSIKDIGIDAVIRGGGVLNGYIGFHIAC